MTHDEINELSPEIMEEVARFINLNPNMKDKDEAVIYALAQLLHDKLEELVLDAEDKGCIVSNLINNFAEFNREELALYHEHLRYLVEAKHSTVH